jgi:hypothetical protein
MAAVLQFQPDTRRTRRDAGSGDGSSGDRETTGEVIIFPGVRIERSDLDLSHRLVRFASEGAPVSPAES